MQQSIDSTDDVPEENSFAYCRAAAAEDYVGVSGERKEDSRAPVRGRSVGHIRARYGGCRIVRRPGDVARVSHEDTIFIYRKGGAEARFKREGCEIVLAPGDLMVADPTLPFADEPRSGFDHEFWFFPRRLVEAHLPVSQRPRSIVLAKESGVGPLVKAYLDAFGRQIGALDNVAAEAIADNFCRLLAVACAAATGERKEEVRFVRLEDAKRHVDRNLADSKLTSEHAARALKISARQLCLLFEPSGTTFVHYVTTRRLEECRAALVNPVGGERSVTDIAFAWGFNSLATFFRRFREAYGMTPSEMRADATRPSGVS
jgi:AraC-like DNA-binding protein